MPKGKKVSRSSGGKKKKDPNAPKRAMSGFMFYSIERRPELKAEHPDLGFGEYGKIIGEEWREMADGEKRPYEAKAEKDKKRYAKEMSKYEPPSDDEDEPRKGKRAKKDPNAPKRAMSGFMFYSVERRPEIKEESPDLPFGDYGKIIGEEWREMTDSEKTPYLKKSERDKKRYVKEMANYTPPPGGNGKGKKKDKNAPKRAMSGFMFYSIERRPELTAENPDLNFGDYGRIIGEEWREMTDHEKRSYMKKSDSDKARYAKEMTKYKKTKA